MAWPAYAALAAMKLLEGNMARKEAKYNRKMYEANARIAIAESNINANKIIDNAKQLFAEQRASYAASGVVLEGTVSDVLSDTLFQGAKEATLIKYSGQLEAGMYKMQAQMQKYNERTAITRSLLSMGTSFAGSKMGGS